MNTLRLFLNIGISLMSLTQHLILNELQKRVLLQINLDLCFQIYQIRIRQTFLSLRKLVS